MIRYSLVCGKGHGFDGWFRDSAAYDSQAADNLLACPECGAHDVEKAMMAPAVPVRSNRRGAVPAAPQGGVGRDGDAAAPAADPRAEAFREALRALRRQVEANADYVGDRFPEEARRIYYAETEARGIYGEATADEAKALLEEGIGVLPLPVLPEEQN